MASTKPTTYGILHNGKILHEYLEKQESLHSTIIDIATFGNTGTESNGSVEAWEAALAYARMVAPSYTNNIGQSWPDLSGFTLMSSKPLYVNSQLKLRHVFGLTVDVNVIAADNFNSRDNYLLDTSLSVSSDAAKNRRPHFTNWKGSLNCRYKCNGIYLHDFLGFNLHGNVLNYATWGVRTGDNGNEFIQMPTSVISQWTYTQNNESDLPPSVTAGTGIYVNCGDCVILGVVAYYKTRGIRVNGRSCYVGAGSHIYGDGKQALFQEDERRGGNLLLDGVWFDASRVELKGEAQMRDCRVYLSKGDSTIGVNIIGGNEVSVSGCVFLGASAGTTAVFRDAVALSNKTCAVHGNLYWDGIGSSDVQNFTIGLKGATTSGTATITSQLGTAVCDGTYVDFEVLADWSSCTGTGNLVLTGLPYTSANHKTTVNLLYNTSSWNSVTSAYIPPASSEVRFKANASEAQVINNGSIVISGRYRV